MNRTPPPAARTSNVRIAGLALVGSVMLLGAAKPASSPRLDTLPWVGPASFTVVARDVTDAAFAVDPSLAANAGLFDDAVRVPSLSPSAVEALSGRLRKDLRKLRALPWRRWDVDTQVDVRWIYAVAETLDHALVVERLYERRPGQWLEPVANTLIALDSYAPERPELQDAVLDRVPEMVVELRSVLRAPTRRDLDTGAKLAHAIESVARGRGHAAAAEALATLAADLGAMPASREFATVGAASYAWRLEHAMLLPWSREELLARATAELAEVEAKMAAIPAPPAPVPTAEQVAAARALDQAGLLAIYDGIVEANRAATIRGGWVSIPPEVGPLRTRPTPAGLIPLTGDGGSMNPPPTYARDNTGWWNVEHFAAEAPEADRIDTIVANANFLENGMGTYSAHEGFPGHHLQLSVARLNPDPVRSILPDCAQNEGWALYAEQVFYEHGGLGSGAGAQRTVLGSYRARIRRVVYDVNLETGAWDLQQAADWKGGTAAGQGRVDEDILRAVNWPTQLVCYFAGKAQILEMREAARARAGAAFDERAFHDAVLRAGSIPLTLTRAIVLGEPVPDFPPEG
jgi:hypothetical protein